MAVRKFILNIGQSNAGAQAPYADWAAQHINLWVDNEFGYSNDYSRGAYADTIQLPGNWAGKETVSLKGAAAGGIRYLTFYNPAPLSPGNATYPHTARITAIGNNNSTESTFSTNTKWQYSPSTKTIVREKTGTTHTMTVGWGGVIGIANANAITVQPPFDPPPEVGEEITYRLTVGINSGNGSYIATDIRFGGDFGGYGAHESSLAGVQLRCISSTHAGNVGLVRFVSAIQLDAGIANDITGAPATVKMVFSQALPHHPNAGDVFVMEPPPVGAEAVTFSKWAYWLPWCPIEGRALPSTSYTATAAAVNPFGFTTLTVNHGGAIVVNDTVRVTGNATYQGNWLVVAATSTTIDIVAAYAGALSGTATIKVWQKINPYPPGFNYVNHIDMPHPYMPFTGDTVAFTAGGYQEVKRAAYHVALASRIQQKLQEPIYVVSLALPGSALADYTYSAYAPPAVGWLDANQQVSWSAGPANNLYQRLVDTLDAAKLAAQREGDTLDCVGIFFIQGEADSLTIDTANNYQLRLRAFKSSVRQMLVSKQLTTLAAATIPWFHPYISTLDGPPWIFADTINASLDALAVEDAYMRTVYMGDAQKIPGDSSHYNASGIALLEARAFDAWQSITESLDAAGMQSDLVVETGTGSATANSYATVAFCDTYFANQGGLAAWTAATPQMRFRALVQATQWIDLVYGGRFAGYRSNNTQALEFPRSLAYDAQGYEIAGIPVALQRATAEMARRWLEDASQFNPDVSAGSNVTQDTVTVGPITISKTYGGGKDSEKRFKIVDRLFQVAGLIDSGGWAKR